MNERKLGFLCKMTPLASHLSFCIWIAHQAITVIPHSLYRQDPTPVGSAETAQPLSHRKGGLLKNQGPCVRVCRCFESPASHRDTKVFDPSGLIQSNLTQLQRFQR